jgi:hypothetical protein
MDWLDLSLNFLLFLLRFESNPNLPVKRANGESLPNLPQKKVWVLKPSAMYLRLNQILELVVSNPKESCPMVKRVFFLNYIYALFAIQRKSKYVNCEICECPMPAPHSATCSSKQPGDLSPNLPVKSNSLAAIQPCIVKICVEFLNDFCGLLENKIMPQ